MAEIARFDGTEAWKRLTPEEQAAIGRTALELGATLAAQTLLDTDGEIGGAVDRAVGAAYSACVDVLEQAATDAFPDVALRPCIASLIDPVCRVCGCSQDDACPEGCGWAEDGLCTACAPERKAA